MVAGNANQIHDGEAVIKMNPSSIMTRGEHNVAASMKMLIEITCTGTHAMMEYWIELLVNQVSIYDK